MFINAQRGQGHDMIGLVRLYLQRTIYQIYQHPLDYRFLTPGLGRSNNVCGWLEQTSFGNLNNFQPVAMAESVKTTFSFPKISIIFISLTTEMFFKTTM